MRVSCQLIKRGEQIEGFYEGLSLCNAGAAEPCFGGVAVYVPFMFSPIHKTILSQSQHVWVNPSSVDL